MRSALSSRLLIRARPRDVRTSRRAGALLAFVLVAGACGPSASDEARRDADRVLDGVVVQLESGWDQAQLPDRFGDPDVRYGGPDEILRLGTRGMIRASSGIGCCFTDNTGWLSEGGGPWTSDALDDKLVPESSSRNPRDVMILDTAIAGGAAVLVGRVHGIEDQTDSTPAAWHSDDLRGWRREELPGDGYLTNVAGGADGWMATGQIDDTIVVYASETGVNWHVVRRLGRGSARAAETLGSSFLVELVLGDPVSRHFQTEHLVWSRSAGWSDATFVRDDEHVASTSEERVVLWGPEGVRWTLDGRTWEPLAGGADPPWRTDDADPFSHVFAELELPNGDDALLASADGATWIATAESHWHRLDLEGRVLPKTPWGDSWSSAITAQSNGSLVMVGGVPIKPGNKPDSISNIWTHPPLR